MNLFTPEFTSLITVFAIGVITLCAIALAPGVYGLIKTNTNAAVFTFLKERAKTFVATLASDPAWGELEGGEKKERAILWLLEFSKEHNIPLDADFAGKIVEEAYVGVKRLVVEAGEILTA